MTVQRISDSLVRKTVDIVMPEIRPKVAHIPTALMLLGSRPLAYTASAKSADGPEKMAAAADPRAAERKNRYGALSSPNGFLATATDVSIANGRDDSSGGIRNSNTSRFCCFMMR